MEKLIVLINKLQDIFSKVDAQGDLLQLPQIVVVGTQSSGKSSIIERIVGRDFLPRGTGIVTRMPLVLHLINCPIESSKRKELGAPEDEDFAVFYNEIDTIYTDFSDVCSHIQEITDAVAGTNKGVVNTSIVLNICSHRYVNLSLVDLPGLTSVALPDQPKDIPEQIRNMVRGFIKNENSIILAVTAANVDIAASEALSLAEEYDPDQERTFAVFTKLDIMDRGTNALDVLTGKALPIKLGIVGVVNRAEADREKSLEDAEVYERTFLEQNYPTIAHKNGCPYLTTILNKILTNKICEVLPELCDRVQEKIKEIQEQLSELGDCCEDSVIFGLKSIEAFVKSYKDRTFNGQDFQFDIKKGIISPAAEISSIFHEDFVENLNKIRPLKASKLEEIELIIRSTTGLNPHILPSSTAFSSLIKREIERFLPPSIRCLGSIHQKMLEAVNLTEIETTMLRFPKFRNFVRNAVKGLLDNQLQITTSIVTSLIKSNGIYINTRFPKFENDYKEITSQLLKMVLPNQIASQQVVPAEVPQIVSINNDAKLISKLIPAYFDSVREIIYDMVPKTIVYNIVHAVHEDISTHLHKAFRNVSDPNVLFAETADVLDQRRRLNERLNALREAENVLDELVLN